MLLTYLLEHAIQRLRPSQHLYSCTSKQVQLRTSSSMRSISGSTKSTCKQVQLRTSSTSKQVHLRTSSSMRSISGSTKSAMFLPSIISGMVSNFQSSSLSPRYYSSTTCVSICTIVPVKQVHLSIPCSRKSIEFRSHTVVAEGLIH